VTDTIDAPALLVPGSAEWHRVRQRGIGSSESPALFGCGFKGETAMKVYLSKVVPPEELAAEKANTAMERGTEMEDYLARLIARRRGWTIRKVPTQIDAKGDPLISSIDYVIFSGPGDDAVPVALLECKTASFRTLTWRDPELFAGYEAVPMRVSIQVCHQLEVGLQWRGRWYYPERSFVGACINHLDDVRIYELPRRDDFGQGIRGRCRELWEQHVVPRVPPAWDGSDAGDELLKRLHPADARPELLRADAAATIEAKELRDARAALDAAEKRKAELEQRLKARIGDATGLVFDGGRITWKATKPTEKTDWQQTAAGLQRALAAEVGDIEAGAVVKELLAANTKTSPGARRFLATFDD
jgi:predicted phage-related endonuclease